MTNAVACLDSETIAAYLDRRLDPAERARVEEHLADCEECRTLLSETAAFLEADAAAKPADVVPLARPVGPTRRPWLWSGVAAAAVLLAVTPIVLRQMRPTPESALRELDRALAGKRYVEGRIAGFEYGALAAGTRGPSSSLESMPPEVLAAAAKIERVTASTETASTLATLGASQLALGRIDSAIENLESGARLESQSPRIRSDLAAAYFARFQAKGAANDATRALEAAASALAVDPKSLSAAFNCAVVLEAIPTRRDDAIRAWDAYLALDASSDWAAEARHRQAQLKASPRAP
jgi:tetratricopeptide (TPR) repeat protein